MKLLDFTIIKLTCFLILGIIISYLYPIPVYLNLCITLALLAVLFIFFLIARKQFVKTIWFGMATYFSMIFIGSLTTAFHNQKNVSNHYSKLISIEKDSLETVTFRIREVLKPGHYHNKYVIDILKINDKTVSGKSLLNIQKDSAQSALKVDGVFIVNVGFQNFNPPLNPHQFNYKKYLEKKYIYHQIFSENKSLLKVSSHTHTLFGVAYNIREHINIKLKRYHFKPDELTIINALLLGQRQDVSKEVYTSYTNAGAIHVLAVSGLHVGIVLLILSLVFKPIERLKHGKFIKTVLLVTSLWCFALIAGLSASVARAATMFSIVAIAINLKRPTNIYNTLAISMFVILLIKPLFVFDVGFQLSYLAVFAIVSIDPVLYNLWRPKNWFLDKYWHTLTVTVSAQFGIIPISLFYFHQFPGLFFISNLVIIPFLGLILGLGILVILLAVTNLLPNFFAQIYAYVISGMNSFVDWVSKQEAFILKDIAFSLLYVFVSYLAIIALVRFLRKRSFANLKLLLISVICIQCAFIYTDYKIPSNEFIVFHKSRYSLLGNITNKDLLIAHDFDSLTPSKNKIIKDFTVGNHIKTIIKDTLKAFYILNDKKLLVVDSLGVYNIKSFEPDYVLLRQSPKINLNRLIDSIKPKYIIADGSNYKSYVKGWEAICLKRKLPFHQTSKKGAFVIKY